MKTPEEFATEKLTCSPQYENERIAISRNWYTGRERVGAVAHAVMMNREQLESFIRAIQGDARGKIEITVDYKRGYNDAIGVVHTAVGNMLLYNVPNPVPSPSFLALLEAAKEVIRCKRRTLEDGYIVPTVEVVNLSDTIAACEEGK